jgi:DNA-binding MarR family transcriptional regulator
VVVVLAISPLLHNYSCVSTHDPLDFTQSLSLLGAAVDDHVVGSLRAAGMTGLRAGHGYYVQRLLAGPATATEMSEVLGISQQAASKAVRELVELGYVSFGVDDADRRRKVARLTERGREAVALARAARADLDDRLRAAVGERRFAAALDVLHAGLGELGLDEAVRTRRVRPPAETS